MDLSRRSLLSAGLVLGATTLTGLSGPLQGARAARALPADPFRLGVASGDPSPSGFVLWTRLAPHPLAPDGLGGMPYRPTSTSTGRSPTDRRLQHARRGRAAVAHVRRGAHGPRRRGRPQPGLGSTSTGSAPRVTSPGRPHPDRPGVARTAADLCSPSRPAPNYEHGYFTGYRRIAERAPRPGAAPRRLHLRVRPDGLRPTAVVRPHTEGRCAHACGLPAAVRAVQDRPRPPGRARASRRGSGRIDDHEVENNWAGSHPGTAPRAQPASLRRRAAAYRAYYENMPLRRASVPQRDPHPAVPAALVGRPGDVPRARHPPVPRRPGLRRRRTDRLRRAPRDAAAS